MVGVGGWSHKVDISSSTLSHSSMFFYQLWNLYHSSFGLRPIPHVCPCSEEWGVSRGGGECVYVTGFPVELHTKHSWLRDGRLESQIHTAGSHRRSHVFVWVEHCHTHTHTHTYAVLTHRNTHTQSLLRVTPHLNRIQNDLGLWGIRWEG